MKIVEAIVALLLIYLMYAFWFTIATIAMRFWWLSIPLIALCIAWHWRSHIKKAAIFL